MDKIKILMAASEAIPYMKTGGLADVVGSLPKYFDKDRYDVRVILPKYKCMDDKLLPQLKFVCHFYVNLNWRRQYVGIFTSQYDGVTYYFVDNEFYFAGDKPYNNIYEDVEKFAFFSKAVLEALPVIDFAPDVIHCNDWQTGLLPVFLKTVYGSDNFYAGIKTVFTIHNMKFQGRWKIKEVADVTGLPEHIFNSGELEFYGEANYLKGGIVYADEITTVSPTYADEICTPEGGEGLDGLMLERRRHLRGIVNGIDYNVFNPMKDTYLDKHFSVRELSGKVVNKRQLQEKYGLAVDNDVMLIGIVSRLTNQKGFDLVAYVMEEMLSTMNVQFIVCLLYTSEYSLWCIYFEKAVQTRWHITNKNVGKMISRIARLSFGVYLLHENSQIRDILWDKWIRLSEYTNDFSIFIIRAIGAVCVIFMAGILLEWIREVGISKVVVEYKVKKREENGTDKKRY